MTEEINKLKAQFNKGFITSDLISSYISLRLDEAGLKYNSVSNVRFDIIVEPNAKLQADITNLIKQLGSVAQSRVVPLIDQWFDKLMDAIEKSKRIETNRDNESLVVRVRSNKIIKSFSKSKGISFDEALRSFSLFEPGKSFFICIFRKNSLFGQKCIFRKKIFTKSMDGKNHGFIKTYQRFF